MTVSKIDARAPLRDAPEDASLLRRLGALLLEQGRHEEAASLFRNAVRAGGDHVDLLQSLESFLRLVLGKGRRKEAEVIADAVPAWPTGRRPDEGERKMLLSLARSLLAIGRPKLGLRLLDQAFPAPPEDAELLLVAGQLRLSSGDAKGALPLLVRSVGLAPGAPAPLIAISAAQARLGQGAQALATVRLIGQCFAYVRAPRRESQRAAVLVLNPAPRKPVEHPATRIRELHFAYNYPKHFRDRLADRLRFLSVLESIPPDVRPWEADRPSVVLNNLEPNRPGRLERSATLVERIGLPVLNPPEALAQASRQKNAERLQGIPGLKVPRLAHYDVAGSGIDAVVSGIGATVGYPVILRHPEAHSTSSTLLGKGPKSAYRVHTPRQARDALAESGWQTVAAVEFVDLRKKAGWYRKLRAFCVGDEVIVINGGCFGEWMVSGWFDKPEGIGFYRAHPRALENLRAILDDPRRELGERCLAALGQIRRRVPLDIFGIDFDVDEAGETVFFEASAAMRIGPSAERVPQDLRLPTEPLDRMDAAFEALVDGRLRRPAAGS